MPAVAGTLAAAANMSVRVENSPGLGRVLVACKAFSVGDEILCEAPLLTWPMEDWGAYLDALCAADEDVRAAVMGLFRPALDSSDAKVASTRTRAQRLLAQPAPPRDGVDLDFVHGALLVAELNAHSFKKGKEMALFELGSKAAHSCSPNAAYSSRDVPGYLRYKAIRPIASGELIAFSYIAGLYSTPTEGRRMELENSKQFLCHCERCDAPDPLRGCRCPTDGCPGVVMPKGNTDGHDLPADWTCSRGGCVPISGDDLEAHLKAEEATNDAMQAAGGAALTNIDLELPSDLEECVNRLPRVHTLSIQYVFNLMRECRLQHGTLLCSVFIAFSLTHASLSYTLIFLRRVLSFPP